MKKIKEFEIEDDIPPNAVFIYAMDRVDCQPVFYYEISNPTTKKESKRDKYKQDLIERTIVYLNNKTGSRYTSKAKAHTAKIMARINEGASSDNFKEVIDNKCSEWLDDEFMRQYLRPDTLFGPKFWSYLPNAKQPADPFAELDKLLEGVDNA